ncbi:KRAB [Lepeophtheirus salmonis]|uniref:KRAB n=1 Tax=Lepeophtheirus salmonis TaxID=72036 RepID=A0A7R8CL97_LEPSM|nr:KRAB [Lepeophtheirus salmonis]CAF2821766.1 KRAB [Lepeophtheirus salmonis]
MCSTLEQIENFLRSPPSDCLNLSTNNGLDLSCSSSLRISLSNIINPQHQHQNEIVNLSTTDSRNYYYPTREEEEYYSSQNSGYDRNSPLNLERRSSPLNLTFATSSKERDISNKYYEYNNTHQNGSNGYYLQNPCGFNNNPSSDYTNYNSYSTNNQNQMYCNYNINYYNPLSIQSNDVYFTCTHCGSNFRDQVSLENHIKTSHKIPSSSTTSSSSQVLEQPQQLPSQHQQPQRIQNDPPTPNSNMNTQFNSSMNPLESLSHPCSECKMTFTSGRDLKKHIDLAHEEFSSTTSLNIHVQEHKSEKPHKCDKCPQLFRNASGLKRHLKRVHGNEKQGFKCETCLKGFYERHDLLRHVKIHSVPKCNDCGKNIKNNHDYSKIAWGIHMWKHTKDSSYITTTEDDEENQDTSPLSRSSFRPSF